MTLSSLRIDAEKKAAALVAAIRDNIVAEIAGGTVTGAAGESLRRLVDTKLETEIPGLRNKFSAEFSQAWKLGLERAVKETLGIGHSPIFAPDNITSYSTNFEKKLWRIESKMADDLDTILLRASLLNKITKDDVLKYVSNRKTGPFGDADKQIVGMVSQLLTDIEDTAHYDEAHLLIAHAKTHPEHFKKKDQKRLAAGENQKLVTLMVQIWYHSHGGNPPRENHVAMNGKAVVYGEPFTLLGKDGVEYFPKYPKDPILPASEAINCHCVGVTKVLTVSKEKADLIMKRLRASGGYKGALLSI